MKTKTAALVLSVLAIIVLSANTAGCHKTQPDPVTSCSERARFGALAQSPYVLPYPVGRSYLVYQTYCGPQNHGRDNQLAYDFEMPLGAPVLAARAGTVVKVSDTLLDRDESRNHARLHEPAPRQQGQMETFLPPFPSKMGMGIITSRNFQTVTFCT